VVQLTHWRKREDVQRDLDRPERRAHVNLMNFNKA